MLWHFREIWEDTEDFNRRLWNADAAVDSRMVGDWEPFRAHSNSAGSRVQSRLERHVRLRAAAAFLATEADAELGSREATLFGLLFLAAVSAHLYGHGFDLDNGALVYHSWLLAAYALSLAMAIVIILRTWYHRVEERRIDFRGLAEGLRVRNFWGLAGIGHSVADGYLGQLRGDIAWARRVLQQCTPPHEYWEAMRRERSSIAQLATLTTVRALWVDDQVRYYRREEREHHQRATGLRRVGFGVAAVGWLVAMWPLMKSTLGVVTHPHAVTQPWRLFEHQLAILAGLLVVTGALTLAYAERRAHEVLARRYRQMIRVFAEGRVDLDDALAYAIESGKEDEKRAALERAVNVLEALGREAMSEHAHWQVLRRSRPFEMLLP